jgi:hypothetical protein
VWGCGWCRGPSRSFLVLADDGAAGGDGEGMRESQKRVWIRRWLVSYAG